MKKGERKYFDYTILYAIFNLFMAFVLYCLSIYFIFMITSGIIFKIVLSIIALPICVQFEYHYIMKIVNPIVDFFIPKKWKQAEKERIERQRQQTRRDEINKKRAEAEANRIAKSIKRKANEEKLEHK